MRIANTNLFKLNQFSALPNLAGKTLDDVHLGLVRNGGKSLAP